MFSRHRIDYNLLFKQQLKSVAVLEAQLDEETDPFIQKALLEVLIEKYDELLNCIRHGADYNDLHFDSLKKEREKQLEEVMKDEDISYSD